jgi:hypothetical protein
MTFEHTLSMLTLFIIFLSYVPPFNFSNNPWTILKLMTNNITTKTNRAYLRAFLTKMSRPFLIITQSQSSFSLKCSPIFSVLHTSPRIIVPNLQSAKNLYRFLHPLISPKTLSMHRNNISFFISIKFTQINSLFQLLPSIQTRTKSIKHT